MGVVPLKSNTEQPVSGEKKKRVSFLAYDVEFEVCETFHLGTKVGV